MSEIFLVPLGFLVGALGTILGAGGGFVLMPALLLTNPDESPEVLTGISLAVVFLNSASGTVAYARLRRIDYVAGIVFALAAVPTVLLGDVVVRQIPRGRFDVLFGAVLLAAATFLMVRPLPGHGGSAQEGTAVPRSGRRLAAGAALSLGVGFIASLLGIGGGIIHVPVLVHLLRFPVHMATATSHFTLAFMSLTATIHRAASGALTRPHFVEIAWIGAGAIAGAQVGAWLSGRLHGRWILRGLAAAIGIVAVRLLAGAL